MKRPAWEVWHVGDLALKGSPDEIVFRRAQEIGAIVLTFDEDFADARMYPAGSHAGVIRLRIWPSTVELTEQALQRLLDTTQDEDLHGSLVIVDEQRIRIRRASRHD